jgi:hypothetical protein
MSTKNYCMKMKNYPLHFMANLLSRHNIDPSAKIRGTKLIYRSGSLSLAECKRIMGDLTND